MTALKKLGIDPDRPGGSRLRALPWTRHCLGCQTKEEE
jgi:DksA/TraR C4-type zinc finger protein